MWCGPRQLRPAERNLEVCVLELQTGRTRRQPSLHGTSPDGGTQDRLWLGGVCESWRAAMSAKVPAEWSEGREWDDIHGRYGRWFLSYSYPRKGVRCRMPRIEPDMIWVLHFSSRVATSCCCLVLWRCPGDRRNRTLLDRMGSSLTDGLNG